MKRLFAVILTFYICSTGLQAVIPDMKFRRLDTRDGLSNAQVNCVFRDSRGYMWIGTPYGLNRYDGYRFKTFYSYARDTTTMRNNLVDEIYEDFRGHLWIKQGMNYTSYDPVTERFNRNPVNELSEFGIQGNIEKLYIDAKKRFWVKTYGFGFYCYDPARKKLSHVQEGYLQDQISKELAIAWFNEVNEHEMIIISTRGELVCIDGEQGQVRWRNTELVNLRNFSVDYNMFLDKEQRLWVMSRSFDVYVFDLKTKRWTSGLGNSLQLMGVSIESMPTRDLLVWDICMDHQGLFWMATDHYGVIVIDPKTHEVRQFTYVKGDETSLCDITVKHFYEDNLGRMWIASFKNGICEYHESQSNFQNFAFGDINAVCEDYAGNWWLGTNDHGVIRYNPATGEQTLFNRQNSGFRNDVIVGAYCSKSGDVWFGTYEGGLLRYHNGQWTNYLYTGQEGGLTTNNVWDITEDFQGNIWLSMLGGGLHRLDVKTGRFRAFMTHNSAINTDWLSSIQRTATNWILAGSSEYYTMINPSNFQIVNGSIPQDPNASTFTASGNHVLMDSRGLIWHGSASGLIIFDRKTKQVTLLDMKSGLYGSKVSSIVEDTKHTMWAVTDHGVSNVIPQKGENGEWTFVVRSYNNRDGLQPGPFNDRAIWLTRDGRILVGGQDGLDVINPLNIGAGQQQQTPVFSGLRLFDTDINPGESYDGHVILDEAIDVCRSLVLKYAENQFTILLGSTSGEPNNRSRFVYKLKGFSDQWIRTDEKVPAITYMSVPSGSYTLCVRMLNDDGTMGEIESELDITILAPWYRSWWMSLFYLLLLGTLGYWLHRRYRLVQREPADNRQPPIANTEPPIANSQEPTVNSDVEEAVLMDEDE